jgi:hypothetical protein
VRFIDAITQFTHPNQRTFKLYTLRERKLRSELFSVYRVYHVSADNILEWMCEV